MLDFCCVFFFSSLDSFRSYFFFFILFWQIEWACVCDRVLIYVICYVVLCDCWIRVVFVYTYFVCFRSLIRKNSVLLHLTHESLSPFQWTCIYIYIYIQIEYKRIILFENKTNEGIYIERDREKMNKLLYGPQYIYICNTHIDKIARVHTYMHHTFMDWSFASTLLCRHSVCTSTYGLNFYFSEYSSHSLSHSLTLCFMVHSYDFRYIFCIIMWDEIHEKKRMNF